MVSVLPGKNRVAELTGAVKQDVSERRALARALGLAEESALELPICTGVGIGSASNLVAMIEELRAQEVGRLSLEGLFRRW